MRNFDVAVTRLLNNLLEYVVRVHILDAFHNVPVKFRSYHTLPFLYRRQTVRYDINRVYTQLLHLWEAFEGLLHNAAAIHVQRQIQNLVRHRASQL